MQLVDSPLPDLTSELFLEFHQRINLGIFKVQCTTFVFFNFVCIATSSHNLLFLDYIHSTWIILF